MNVVFLGGKASAVTTTTLVAASGWARAAQAVMVEVDPAGGDLCARFDLPATPSLLTAAATLQRPTPASLMSQTQLLPGGVRVIPAPVRGPEVIGAVADFSRAVLAPLRGSQELDLLVDCGRCDPRSLPSVTALADLAVLVIRQDFRSAPSTVGRCLHAAALAEPLAARGIPMVAVVIGDAPYRPAEIAEFLGMPITAVLPEDPHGASNLAGRPSTSWAARRTRLAMAAPKFAAGLASVLDAQRADMLLHLVVEAAQV